MLRAEAGSANYLPRQPLFALAARMVVRTVALLSIGRLEWRHNNVTFILQKPLQL